MNNIKVQYNIHFVPKSKGEILKVSNTSFKDDVHGTMQLLSPIVQDRLHLSEVRTKFIDMIKGLLWLVGYHEVEIEDRTNEMTLLNNNVVFVWSYDLEKTKSTSMRIDSSQNKIG